MPLGKLRVILRQIVTTRELFYSTSMTFSNAWALIPRPSLRLACAVMAHGVRLLEAKARTIVLRFITETPLPSQAHKMGGIAQQRSETDGSFVQVFPRPQQEKRNAY